MGKLGKIIAFTAFLAVLIGIGMVAVQGKGSLVIRDFDLTTLARVKKIQIGKLRDLIKGDVTHEYMLDDAFLLKWLLDQDFEVKQAAELIKQNLKWRADEKMDSILEENFDDIKSVLPHSMDTTDKIGRPVIYFDFGQWDVAKLVSEQPSGKERFERYFYAFWESVEQRIRDLRAEGQNVTQAVVIVNVDNFSLEKQGCIQCLQAYRNIGLTLASNFPWPTERNLIVNVPYVFDVVYAYLSDRNKKNLNMLGTDKSVWEPTILETIDRTQLPRGLLEQQTQFMKPDSGVQGRSML